jgi:hypothetical protein
VRSRYSEPAKEKAPQDEGLSGPHMLWAPTIRAALVAVDVERDGIAADRLNA